MSEYVQWKQSKLQVQFHDSSFPSQPEMQSVLILYYTVAMFYATFQEETHLRLLRRESK